MNNPNTIVPQSPSKITPSKSEKSLSALVAARAAAAAAAKRHLVIMADTSGSMDYHDAGGGKRRIDVLQTVLNTLRVKHPRIRLFSFATALTPCDAGMLPPPSGGTNLGGALREVAVHLNQHSILILISDGEPDSEQDAFQAAGGIPCRLEVFYVGPEGGPGSAFLAKLAAAVGGGFSSTPLSQSKQLESKVEKVLSLPPGGRR